MKVLHIAAGLPSSSKPYYQPFIRSQILSLRDAGIDCGTFEIENISGKFKYLSAAPRIRAIVQNEGYDILHAHYSYCGLSAYLACTGRPIVLSLMGSDLLGRPGADGRINLRGLIDKKITEFTYRRVDHIIVKSKQMRNMLNGEVPVSVIPNGVDFSQFTIKDTHQKKVELGFREDDFIVLFLGNKKIIRKNYKLARESFDLFAKDTNDPKIKFINPFGLDHNKIVDYMNAADVLLLTSFWEGSPNVIKEAMACNLPIISVNVGDVSEIFNGARQCFVVPGTPEAFSEKLNIIFRNRIRSNGREKINHLRNEYIAEYIIDIYNAILNKNRLAAPIRMEF